MQIQQSNDGAQCSWTDGQIHSVSNGITNIQMVTTPVNPQVTHLMFSQMTNRCLIAQFQGIKHIILSIVVIIEALKQRCMMCLT